MAEAFSGAGLLAGGGAGLVWASVTSLRTRPQQQYRLAEAAMMAVGRMARHDWFG
jgi:hypothetical protein